MLVFRPLSCRAATAAVVVATAVALASASAASACRCFVLSTRAQVEQALAAQPVELLDGRRVVVLRSACHGKGTPVVARTPAGRQQLYRFFACTLTSRAASAATAVEVAVTGFDATHELPLLAVGAASAARAGLALPS